MTFYQVNCAYKSVCRGARAPLLVQLSTIDFHDLAKIAVSTYPSDGTPSWGEKTFQQIVKQGWFMLLGVLAIRDKDHSHPIGMMRFFFPTWQEVLVGENHGLLSVTRQLHIKQSSIDEAHRIAAWNREQEEKKRMEELVADIALAIQVGLCKQCDRNNPGKHKVGEPRFTTEVVSSTQLTLTDADDQQYKITIEEIPTR